MASRICIIKPSALGDIVHALPVLTGLRRRFPDSAITWVVNRAYEPLLVGHPDLTDTLVFDRAGMRRGWWRGLTEMRRCLDELRRRRFDLVLDLQGLFRSGVMTWATRAPRRIGLSSAREGSSWFCTDIVPGTDRAEAHAVDRYWSAAAYLGADERDRVFRFPAFEQEEDWAATTLKSLPRPWIAAGVGARWLTKRWPPSHFGELLGRAQSEFGGTVVFVGGGEDSAPSLEAARGLAGPMLMLTGGTSIPQLVAVLRRADVMVAGDTGPLHLARALGKPVVAPYTCTRIEMTGPYGQAGAVATTVPCAGSLRKRCSTMICTNELTPARLMPRFEEVLTAWQANRHPA